MELEDAKAMLASPQLVKLRELRTLVEIARAGGKIVMGVKPMIGDE